MIKRQKQIKTQDYCFYDLLLNVNEDEKTSQFSGKFYYKDNYYGPTTLLDLLNEKLPENTDRIIEIKNLRFEYHDDLWKKVYDFEVKETFE